MSRFQLLMLSICVVAMTVGCRNRCPNQFAQYGGQYGGGVFSGGSPTIAPPPTYSLNIPSVAKNQPYYTPGQAAPNAAPNNFTLNTNQRAPTPATPGSSPAATRQATQLNQSGWRSVNNNLGSNINSGGAPDSNNGRSVLAAPTRFVESNSGNNSGTGSNTAVATNSGSGTRTASAAPLPGSGVSFTNSQNYQTTRVDETQDATRLALTDATTVRAPARNFPTGTPLATVQNNGYPANYQAGFNAPIQQQTFVAQNVLNQRQPTGYAAAPVIIGGQPVPTGYQGQPLLVNPQYPAGYQTYPTSSAPTVLAQSTATINPSGSASQLGWRDRDLTGRSNRF